MSFVTYDYWCNKCGKTEERFLRRAEMDQQHCECGHLLTRLPSAPATTFKFADTSAVKTRRKV